MPRPVGLITSRVSDGFFSHQTARSVDTPWGSASVIEGVLNGITVYSIERYGRELAKPSHRINYRANLWALRSLGVRRVLSQNAIGSVNPVLRPGDIMIPHDFLDKTKSRVLTFFDSDDAWVRVDMTEPFCPELRDLLVREGANRTERLVPTGVFACTEGPRFETPSEIRALRREGADIVGTPLVPEVVLAREAELCFASIAPIINYGAGLAPRVVHTGEDSMVDFYYTGGVHDLVEAIIAATAARITDDCSCTCRQSLKEGFHGTPPSWLVDSSIS